jgi:hypothetical protein
MDYWRPMETLPERTSVDVWVHSLDNPDYGRRACGIAMVDGEWYGAHPPEEKYGEYAAFWMPIPAPPTCKQNLQVDPKIVAGHVCWSCMSRVDHATRSPDNPARTDVCMVCNHRGEGVRSTAQAGAWGIMGPTTKAALAKENK